MCLSPILIPNLNRGLDNRLSDLFDTDSAYLKVPCGHCSECIHNKQMSILQRVQTMALDHHVFFGTFTYNEEMIPRLSVDVTDPFSGEIKTWSYRYADVHDFQNVVKRIRKDNLFTRPFSYFLVSELGEAKGRPHFHCLFFIPKDSSDNWMDVYNLEHHMYKTFLSQWKRNVATRVNKNGDIVPDNWHPVYKPLCTYFRRMIAGKMSYNYDLHYVEETIGSDSSGVAAYCTKYMLKPSSREQKLQRALRLNLSDDQYKEVWKTVRPRYVCSKHFGAKTDEEIAFVRSSVIRSKLGYLMPMYLAPNGNTYPLSRYYRNDDRIMTVSDEFDFYHNDPDRQVRRSVTYDDRDNLDKLNAQSIFDNKVRLVDSHDSMSQIMDLLTPSENA